jgi:4'-phosphopantetheinyl transferase
MSPDLIRLWFASVEDCRSVLLETPAPLSAEEQQRAGDFQRDQDRLSFLLGRRMARALLARALGCAPAAVTLALDGSGKPGLAGPAAGSGLAFNISHSGDLVVCAVAIGRSVGVDIERERDDLELLDIAGRYFCANELRRLEESASPQERRRLFFRYWTLKEAYLKAHGAGLGIALSAIDVSAVPEGGFVPPGPPAEDRPRGIQVQPLTIAPRYAAAVAATGPTWQTEIHRSGPDALPSLGETR